MLITESVFEALREVKRLAVDLHVIDEIYFLHSEDYETFLVSDDASDVSEQIHSYWNESACERDPYDESNYYSGVVYKPAGYYEKFPKRNMDGAKTWPSVSLIRIPIEVQPEHSVTFNLESKY